MTKTYAGLNQEELCNVITDFVACMIRGIDWKKVFDDFTELHPELTEEQLSELFKGKGEALDVSDFDSKLDEFIDETLYTPEMAEYIKTAIDERFSADNVPEEEEEEA